MRAWVLAVLLVAAVWAQEPRKLRLEVVFHTVPPHLLVYQATYEGLNYLGRSDQPLMLNVLEDERLKIYFVYDPGEDPPIQPPSLEGRQVLDLHPNDLKVVEARAGSPQQAVFPEQGTYLVPLTYAERALLETHRPGRNRRRLLIGLGLVTLLGGLGSWGWKRRRAEKDLLMRAETLLDMNTRIDIRDPVQGKIFGSYRLLEKIGSGGMATVYRGVPESSLDESEAVAVKVLHTRDGEVLDRLRREVEVCQSLQHPNIVRFIEADVEADRVYIVMELIRGNTLRSSVRSGGMPAAAAFALLKPVMSALTYAHDRGVVHRDLKPDNVMLTSKGNHVVLMDFGLARRHDMATVTTTGSLLGTPAYVSPEQVQGHYDARSDQYALGVMAFELLTGKLPFLANDPIQLIMAHMQTPPPRLCQVKPSLPARLEPVLERMLSKSPDDRYFSMVEVMQAWQDALP